MNKISEQAIDSRLSLAKNNLINPIDESNDKLSQYDSINKDIIAALKSEENGLDERDTKAVEKILKSAIKIDLIQQRGTERARYLVHLELPEILDDNIVDHIWAYSVKPESNRYEDDVDNHEMVIDISKYVNHLIGADETSMFKVIYDFLDKLSYEEIELRMRGGVPVNDRVPMRQP
jgi:hypothetical protein